MVLPGHARAVIAGIATVLTAFSFGHQRHTYRIREEEHRLECGLQDEKRHQEAGNEPGKPWTRYVFSNVRPYLTLSEPGSFSRHFQNLLVKSLTSCLAVLAA